MAGLTRPLPVGPSGVYCVQKCCASLSMPADSSYLALTHTLMIRPRGCRGLVRRSNTFAVTEALFVGFGWRLKEIRDITT